MQQVREYQRFPYGHTDSFAGTPLGLVREDIRVWEIPDPLAAETDEKTETLEVPRLMDVV